MEESEKRSIIVDENVNMKEGNITLVLDSYDALFSDFDPRPFSERSLSDDFLLEFKKAGKDRKKISELRLLMPRHLRKVSEEGKIKKRLKEYFKKHYIEKGKEIKEFRRKGIMWFLAGSLILAISTSLYEYKGLIYKSAKFVFDFLFIISQPAGWFTIWEGLDRFFLKYKEALPDYHFYKKISEANIYFLNY